MIEGILIMKEYSVLGNEANENNIVCYYLRYRGRDSPSFERSGPDDAWWWDYLQEWRIKLRTTFMTTIYDTVDLCKGGLSSISWYESSTAG